MQGQQVYIYQKNNILPDADITASVARSERRPLVYPKIKKGNGDIRIHGYYTGDKDAVFEVKILDMALSRSIVSAPVFRGAGTGQISGIVASGLKAQKIRVLCLSTGTDSEKASITIEGLDFRAKEAGARGNDIYITVDDSGLSFQQTDYTLLKDLKIGDTGLEGSEWDWDTKEIHGGLIPTDAHRVAFGQDEVHIYLQYKKYKDGSWKYYFIPSIKANVASGTKVYFVEGSRTITVSDGVTTEVYTGIVTIADFWSAVRANSSLIEPVQSSINLQREEDSPAVREFSTKTSAYFLPPYAKEGSSKYAGELKDIYVTNKAKTELIAIECIDNTYVGNEVWSVSGTASGDLGTVQTDVPASFDGFGFRIPKRLPQGYTTNDNWSYKVNAQRDPGVTPPAICFSMRLGINAKPQTLTLTYKKKPAECDCTPASFSEKCLGLDTEGGEKGMGYFVEDLIFWTDVVAERMKEQWGKHETYEGRESESSSNVYWNFSKRTKEYFNLFKTLAQRIMALPEDDTTTLQVIVNEYKQLVNSISIYCSDYDNNESISTWDGSKWSPKLPYINDVHYDTDLYQTLADRILLYEKTYGVKKNRIVAQGTCYVDQESDYYWEVSGDKAYLPAYTDTPYYSTIQKGEDYENTKEFAFLISTPCQGSLMEGDTIVVNIGGREIERTYQVGDVIYLPTIAGQDLHLSGGVDGDDTYVFEVSGDIDSFPNYYLNRQDPQPYYHPKLQFWITDGAVPFSVGDYFEFSIEGGRFIYRKDGGPWSSPISIQEDIQPLADGLSIGFEFGVSPSFEVNDTWEIVCIQENKASQMTTPRTAKRWKGTGNITIDAGAMKNVDILLIDGHNLTTAFTFKASNLPDFSTLVYSEVITPSPGIICKLLPNISARYFRLEIAEDPAEITYLFLGLGMTLSLDADSIRPIRRYQMVRQPGKEPFSLLSYAQKGYEVEYASFIMNNDFQKIDEMISYLKERNDLPFYFIPNVNYPDDCIKVWVDTDNIEIGSEIDFNAPADKRIYNLKLPLVGA